MLHFYNSRIKILTLLFGLAFFSITKHTFSQSILAVYDYGFVEQGSGSTAIMNVLANDTLNSMVAPTSSVILSQIRTTDAGVTLNSATGAIDVTTSVPKGRYELVYEICESAAPINCSQITTYIDVIGPGFTCDAIIYPVLGKLMNQADVTYWQLYSFGFWTGNF